MKNKHIRRFNESDENLNISDENDTNSLIMKLRSELDEIREKYKGILNRNTIKDEFEEQIGKV